jgi:hypothetical protein
MGWVAYAFDRPFAQCDLNETHWTYFQSWMFHMHMIRVRDTRSTDLLGPSNSKSWLDAIFLAGTQRHVHA